MRLRLVRSEDGQASVLIGTMILTFLLFFCFAVNIGMLVNAKINLQNAADLAAYSGAATQARQLNQIGFLNYEMRRQYKKFLFRYYVVGNVAYASKRPFQNSATPRMWSPNGVDNYGAPVICLIFNQGDNYCQVIELKHINTPDAAAFSNDAIQQTLISQLAGLEELRKRNCGKIGITNLYAANLWLYNTDPTLANLTNPSAYAAGEVEAPKVMQMLRAVGQGIGLVPRNVITLQRINTLAGYLNSAPASSVDFEAARSLAQRGDPADERTANAFLSAYYTLGSHTFSGADVRMTELSPTPGSQTDPGGRTTPVPYFAYEQVKVSFDVFSIVLNLVRRGNGEDCVHRLAVVPVSNVPVGVAKDPKLMTYYAVRLSAKAKTLFSPFGDLELKAYAAARPYGSRIGPPRAEAEAAFVSQHAANSNLFAIAGAANNLFGTSPNVAMTEGDPSGGPLNYGYAKENLMFLMNNQIRDSQASAGGTKDLTERNLEYAYDAAMAPNPWEFTRYNIINDLLVDIGSGNDFSRWFDQNQVSSVWAPVMPGGDAARAQDQIRALVDGVFSPRSDSSQDPGAVGRLRNALMGQLDVYLQALRSGGVTEVIRGTPPLAEGNNVMRVTNPFLHRPVPNAATGVVEDLSALRGDYFDDTPEKVRTSWNAVRDAQVARLGRVGYSVKFVPLKTLNKGGTRTNASTNFTNLLKSDAESDADLPELQH